MVTGKILLVSLVSSGPRLVARKKLSVASDPC